MKIDKTRLEEIKEEIKELAQEAIDLIPWEDAEYDRAKGYWYSSIVMALDADHEFLGGRGHTMQETIDASEQDDS